MSRRAGYILLDHTKNEDVSQEIYMRTIEKKLLQHIQNWLDLVRIMRNIKHPKQFLDYRPVEKRRHRRPLKRLLVGYNVLAEIGHLLSLFHVQKKIHPN